MFETLYRIEATLSNMAVLFPERRFTLARRIIKTFEVFLNGTASEIQTASQADNDQIRDETVLILHPVYREKHGGLPEATQHIMNTLTAEPPVKQAAKLAAEITDEGKKALHDLALTHKNKGKTV